MALATMSARWTFALKSFFTFIAHVHAKPDAEPNASKAASLNVKAMPTS
jgi:hypothetical protein